jgi:hypothetical protein
VQLFRWHPAALHAKSTGQSPAELHGLGPQWLSVMHASPVPHIASDVQPGVHAFWPEHAHTTGTQMYDAPCALQSASPVHVTGGLSHTPQPANPPGAKHSSKPVLQSASRWHCPFASPPPVPPVPDAVPDVVPEAPVPLVLVPAPLPAPPVPVPLLPAIVVWPPHPAGPAATPSTARKIHGFMVP